MKLIQKAVGVAWLLLGLVVSTRAQETGVVKEANVNVRGLPSFSGEIITQLKQGEKVVILEEIANVKPAEGEPAKWFKIRIPTNTPVWVFAPFIDPTSKTVKVSRLNLRGGPGENYSVLGRLQRGDSVKEIRSAENWLEIEAPPTTYVYVAAHLITRDGSAALPTTLTSTAPASPQPASPSTTTAPATAPGASATIEPPSASVPITSAAVAPAASVAASVPAASGLPGAPAAPTTLEVGTTTPGALATTVVAAAPTTAATALPAASTAAAASAAVTETLATPPVAVNADTAVAASVAEVVSSAPAAPRRVVIREGIVRGTLSIQAPTYFELVSTRNRKLINYLHTPDLDLDLRDYVGRTIVVSGEEGVDPRWPNTPVIAVETLKLVL